MLFFVADTDSRPWYGNLGCFPSEAKVRLENGDSVTMSELQIGDKVQTGIGIKIFKCIFIRLFNKLIYIVNTF